MNPELDLSQKEIKNGFTLIEVMIALAFFSVCMLGLGVLQLNSMKSVTKAKTITIASALAHSEMELLKSIPMDDSKLIAGSSTIEEKESFWIQRNVRDDYPIGKRDVDSGLGLVSTTICKTISITVFDDAAGAKVMANCSFIKSHAAIE